ncbi:MAG: hypothetical protein ACREQY_15010, partial [Candidatus Binatia bacterium]
MRIPSRLALSILLVVLAPTPVRPMVTVPDGPRAPRADLKETFHGLEVADSYRPLEDLGSEATRAWVASQDRSTRARLDARPAFRELSDRLDRLTRVAAVTPPATAGARLFYLATPPEGNRPSLWMKEGDGAQPKRLLDGEAIAGSARIVGIWPSPDGARVAYGLREPASNWAVVRFLDIPGGRLLADELRGLHAAAYTVSWSRAGDRVYYGRFEEPAPGSEQSTQRRDERLIEHVLDTPVSRDRTLFAQPEQPSATFSPRVSDDGRLLVLAVSPQAGTQSELRVMNLSDFGAGFRVLGDARDSTTVYLTSRGTELLLHTTRGAERGRIVSVELSAPEAERVV